MNKPMVISLKEKETADSYRTLLSTKAEKLLMNCMFKHYRKRDFVCNCNGQCVHCKNKKEQK